jgi:adenylylsulfate kinase-like enzyme/phosphohistidine swiveling domain-containing protein
LFSPTLAQRFSEQLNGEQVDNSIPGRVFWITGLSGSGKTTIGERLSQRLRGSGRSVLFLDGDNLRSAIAEDLGHLTGDRRRSAMRNGRLCLLLSEQGVDVVCATISMFHEVQRWNREHISEYFEIYLRVPMDEVERRDAKGIYARARQSELRNVVGIDIAAEEPESPDLTLDNHGELDPDTAVDLIWARLATDTRNSLRATPAVRFGTKAETLERLAPRLGSAKVLPQVRFSIGEWSRDRDRILACIAAEPWGNDRLAVRSSAQKEDTAKESAAGKYDSVLGAMGHSEIVGAVEQVVASFKNGEEDDQIFVQPLLRDVAMAGVAFTRDPNGAGPYIVINYDDSSGRTDLVTSGRGGELKTFFLLKHGPGKVPASLVPVVELIREIEELLDCDSLDLEFAVDRGSELYLLQVRPLIVKYPSHVATADVRTAANQIACKFELLSRPHPHLHGARSVFGVMPDWNPAEIIGLRPKPLALTLYRNLVTDAIWAYQRDNYGYKNLRSFPLMVNFQGLPYIDLRVSFNSFVPRDVTGVLAERLVNYYIERLVKQPDLHDKVEFAIVFSCYTLDLPERIAALNDHGFSQGEVATLSDSLRRLTNRIIHGETGLWRQDREKIDILISRLPIIKDARIDKISRIYWLLEDCKRYGTLPFAGLARAGFIAVQLLQSLVATGVIDEAQRTAFLTNLDTVGSHIGRDFASMPRERFFERYGHLRPGTYDILSPRYDEEPDLYFDWSAPRAPAPAVPPFALSLPQLRHIERLLKEHRLEHDVLGFMDFIKAGIEGREFAKFVFSRSLSDALSLIKQVGEEHGIDVEDCAYINLATIRALYRETGSVGARLRESIAEGKRRYALSRSLILPPLLTAPEDVFGFHLPQSQPNFITQKAVTSPRSWIKDPPESFAGTILFVPSADPGFDWIFTRGISGFVTQFGGVNSHMAIRAGELGIPAVIGAGEVLFERWRAAKRLCLDCGNRQVRLIA